jgi:hypothetical protein
MSNKSSIHRRVYDKRSNRAALVGARMAARGFAVQSRTTLGQANGETVLGCGALVPQTPGYCSRLAQPVPGSLTRPHKPPSNLASIRALKTLMSAGTAA